VVLQLQPPTRKGPFFLNVFGRLKQGVAPSAAAAELRAINERIFPLWQASWSDQETTWAMTDLKAFVLGDVRVSLLVVLGAAVFILLMVSVNAAGLLLARLMDRRRELAVRTTLGASRGRLVGHLLAESVTLALLGAGTGLLVSLAGIHLATTVGAAFIPRTGEVGLTAPVWLFFGIAATASLLLFGLLPALHGTRIRMARELREGSRNSPSGGARRTRSLLVATQVAVAIPILVGSGLLVTSFGKLTRIDSGFDAEQLLTLNVALPADPSVSTEELSGFWRTLLAEIRSLPGVEEAGVGRGRPPAEAPFTNNFVLEDQPLAPGETQLSVPWVFGSHEYFEALGTRLVAGRGFDAALDDSQFVVLVDEAWALRFFDSPGDAVGRRFRSGGCTGEDCPWGMVIGVMEEVRYSGLREANPGTMFLDADANPSPNSVLVVRTMPGADPAIHAPRIRALIREADVEAAVSRIATGEELLRTTLQVPRYLATIAGAFGAISLLLAILGIYGIMDTFVRQHRRDIGIRLALGGEPGRVVGLVLKRGMSLVALGVGVGLIGAVALTGLLEAMLFGVRPTDPLVMGTSASLMLLLAAGACWGPAARAARIPPREVMAEE
jgi:predicted permease